MGFPVSLAVCRGDGASNTASLEYPPGGPRHSSPGNLLVEGTVSVFAHYVPSGYALPDSEKLLNDYLLSKRSESLGKL